MVRSPVRVAVVASALIVLTNGPLFLVARHTLEGTGNWEDPVVRSPIVATSMVAVGLVALDRFRLSGRRLAPPSPYAAIAIAAYSALAVLSAIWSLAPDLTLWRATAYLGLPFLAWVVADLDDERWCRAMFAVVGVAVVGSLVMLVFSPAIGLDRNDDWRGIYTNRNTLAPLAALGVVMAIATVWRPGRRRRLSGWALGAASVVVLLGTGSRTAWLAMLVAIGAGALVVVTRRVRDRFGASAAIRLAAGVGGVGLVGLALAMSRLWSESTFEQRRTIWSLAWDRIEDRPWHGHGFFAVWDVPEFVSDHYLLERGSAHNSALEVWLGIGVFGLAAFGVVVGLALYSVGRDAWSDPRPETWAWLVVVLFLLLENLTESFVLWFSYNWVIIMAAALRVGMHRHPDPTGASSMPRGEVESALASSTADPP